MDNHEIELNIFKRFFQFGYFIFYRFILFQLFFNKLRYLG